MHLLLVAYCNMRTAKYPWNTIQTPRSQRSRLSDVIFDAKFHIVIAPCPWQVNKELKSLAGVQAASLKLGPIRLRHM